MVGRLCACVARLKSTLLKSKDNLLWCVKSVLVIFTNTTYTPTLPYHAISIIHLQSSAQTFNKLKIRCHCLPAY